MTEPLHPTATEYQRAEKRFKAAAAKLASEKAHFEAARAARDDAIRNDPETNHAAVGRRFGVSATWVKKIRGAAREPDNQ